MVDEVWESADVAGRPKDAYDFIGLQGFAYVKYGLMTGKPSFAIAKQAAHISLDRYHASVKGNPTCIILVLLVHGRWSACRATQANRLVARAYLRSCENLRRVGGGARRAVVQSEYEEHCVLDKKARQKETDTPPQSDEGAIPSRGAILGIVVEKLEMLDSQSAALD